MIGFDLTCHFCKHCNERCLPDGIELYKKLYSGGCEKESCRICKNFEPAAWVGVLNGWEGIEEYKKELGEEYGLNFDGNDPLVRRSLNVGLTQDNEFFSIPAENWIAQDYTDEQGKINKWVRRYKFSKRDINFKEEGNE